MGIIAHGQVVVTGTQDITLRTLGVIAGQHIAFTLDCDGLALTGLQRIGFFETDNLYGGFFDAVLLLVIAVGRLGIHFDYALTGHIAGVGYFHLNLIIVGIGVESHTLERLGEIGIGQTITEGIDNLIGVIPTVSGGRADGGGSIPAAHDRIFIAGFVVFVSHIDTLGADGVVIYVDSIVGKVGGLAVDVVHIAPQLHILAGIGGGRGRQRVGSVGIYQMTAGGNLTGQHIGNALVADNTGHAGQHAGINIIIVQPIQFHHLVSIDDDNDLFEHTGGFLGFQIGHQVFFVGLQTQKVRAVLAKHGGIVALAAQTGKYGNGGIVVIAGPAAGIFFYVRNGSFHNLGGSGGTQRCVSIVQQRSVDIIRAKNFLHSSAEGHSRNRRHAGSRAFAHGGMSRTVTENGHTACVGKRQGCVFVAKQNRALLGLGYVFCSHFHFYLQGGLFVGVVGAELVVIIGSVHGTGVVGLYDLACVDIQCFVDGTGIGKHQG